MSQRRDYLLNRSWLGYCRITLTLFLLGQVFLPVRDFSLFLPNKDIWSHFHRKACSFSAQTLVISICSPQKQDPFYSTSDHVKSKISHWRWKGLNVIRKGFALVLYIAGLPCGLRPEGTGVGAEMSIHRCFCLLGRCPVKIKMFPGSLS